MSLASYPNIRLTVQRMYPIDGCRGAALHPYQSAAATGDVEEALRDYRRGSLSGRSTALPLLMNYLASITEAHPL